MKVLLVALGILVCFGILFWLDRYYREDDEVKEGQEPDSSGSDGEERDSGSDNK